MRTYDFRDPRSLWRTEGSNQKYNTLDYTNIVREVLLETGSRIVDDCCRMQKPSQQIIRESLDAIAQIRILRRPRPANTPIFGGRYE